MLFRVQEVDIFSRFESSVKDNRLTDKDYYEFFGAVKEVAEQIRYIPDTSVNFHRIKEVEQVSKKVFGVILDKPTRQPLEFKTSVVNGDEKFVFSSINAFDRIRIRLSPQEFNLVEISKFGGNTFTSYSNNPKKHSPLLGRNQISGLLYASLVGRRLADIINYPEVV